MLIVLIILAVIAVVVVLGLLLRRGLLVSRVRGGSMLPTYQDGDMLLAVRRGLFRRPRAGDVVVCRLPYGFAIPGGGDNPLLVKRVGAVAGDPRPGGDGVSDPLPAGTIYVVGDSPGHSLDSNTFGPLPEDLVVGVVVRRMSGAQPSQSR
ncbi:S26 family signal peptidase [Dactylosporangium sp. NPDC000555]|uniref:S26 family signal peptidase n=1 Tax=Dactylosporangium sp. NPDC000555 TaxID=3154260 RepID=UPI00332CDA2B